MSSQQNIDIELSKLDKRSAFVKEDAALLLSQEVQAQYHVSLQEAQKDVELWKKIQERRFEIEGMLRYEIVIAQQILLRQNNG